MTTLNAAAQQTCAENYGSWRAKDNGCDRCPIHRECTAVCGGGLSAYREWLDRVNAAAICTKNAKISTRFCDVYAR